MRSRRRNAPSVPATLQRSASASSRRFSLPENCRRLAFATTSGSRRGASSEAISPAALRAPSEAASEEEPSNPFMEDFSNEVMVMSYLSSKLPETGVSPHIGTEGIEALPDVPTVTESGYKDSEADLWFGLAAPAKTPKETVSQLAGWFTAALDVLAPNRHTKKL